jgi:hypothetical protein
MVAHKQALRPEHLAPAFRRARVRERRGTDPCVFGRGPRHTRRSKTTQEGVLGAPACSWSARSSWPRPSACPTARVGVSQEFYGCGGTGRKGQGRASISPGARMCGVSIWSTPSASSSRAWDGRRRGCATPSRPAGGRKLRIIPCLLWDKHPWVLGRNYLYLSPPRRSQHGHDTSAKGRTTR